MRELQIILAILQMRLSMSRKFVEIEENKKWGSGRANNTPRETIEKGTALLN
jgi:hypothetical protein